MHKGYVKHSEYDMIQLTPQGHNIAEALENGELGTGTAADDVIAYLDSSPDMQASCGEIGMNIKITGDELKEVLHKLEAGGLVIKMAAMSPKHGHVGAGFGSYRGGMAPHEYLGQEVEEHEDLSDTAGYPTDQQYNYCQSCGERRDRCTCKQPEPSFEEYAEMERSEHEGPLAHGRYGAQRH